MTDEELIEQWKKTRNRSAYSTLKQRHSGMVYQKVNMYTAAQIPRASLESQAWILFDDAINGFKPGMGAKFSTYLDIQLRKLDRHTKKYQNIGRIPESLAGRIGEYQSAIDHLGQKLKRQPHHHEVASHMNMEVKHVKQLHKSLRGDLFEGKFEGEEHKRQEQDMEWLLEDLRDELSPQEKEVYDYLIGHNKPRMTDKKALAKKLGISPGRLSQITKSISIKLDPLIKKHM